MAMTAAERAKKYRDSLKSDPNKHAEYLKKERNRYKERKAKGQYDLTDKSERQKNYIKRKWRQQKRKQREKQKAIQKGVAFMNNNSPETSPSHRPNQSAQQTSGRKRMKRDRAKAYRHINLLEEKVNYYKRLWEKVRKKETRPKKRLAAVSKKIDDSNELVVQSIAKKFKTSKTLKERKEISQIVAKDLLKKCRGQMKYIRRTGISWYRLNSNKLRENMKKCFIKTGQSMAWNMRLRERVKTFLEEDINSTMAPGKKDTITRHGRKKQKRYLNNSLLNLHIKFNESYPSCKLSYSSFCRFRPFWVVSKKIQERDTCLCKLHENVKHRVRALHKMKVVGDNDSDKLAEKVVCDLRRKQCAYGDCERCKSMKIPSENIADLGSKQIQFFQWCNRTEEYIGKDGIARKTQKTVKVEEQSTVENLLVDTTKLMKDKYTKHIFNIRHQFKCLKSLKDNITEKEAVLQVDFSENYDCKLSEEIQSMHFGGSRHQVSLHTVVLYTKNAVKSICTVSPSTLHNPGAIWAHLRPVLTDLRMTVPNITTLHFVSDGPCTQYRSKNHFYMFHSEIIGNYEFENASWNFTEAGHGKSAADGVGGTVKRTADALVAKGTDITDAIKFHSQVSENLQNIKLYFITEEDINKSEMKIPKKLQAIKGTMKLHQVIINQSSRGLLYPRELSCFCQWPQCCDCFVLADGTKSHKVDVPVAIIEAAVTGTDDNMHVAEEDTSVNPNPDLIGSWCVVVYDGEAYPGLIQDADGDSAEVKAMHRVGENRFFWPLMEDVIWYKWTDVLMTIPPPEKVTGRHVQVDPLKWADVKQKLKQI